MPVIATAELTKSYPGVTALDRLTVDIAEGVTGLVGANGAGKSTLIKVLLGLVPATAGRASVLGLDCASEGSPIRERVGYMPEHDCLPPDVSATEFVVHMARMSGLPPAQARERTADTLRHVGLYEERYRPIGGYSTGMRQRVKLAQSLVHDPALVFLDEPTNGLDPAGRDDMLALVRRIGTEFGISVLVTSHLLGELERICDHVVILDTGRLLRSSATAEFVQATRVLSVEVTAGPPDGTAPEADAVPVPGDRQEEARDRLGHALAGAGVVVRPDGRMLAVDIADDHTVDVVRDLVSDLGLALVRMHQRRHRMDEVFRTPVEPPAPGPATPEPTSPDPALSDPAASGRPAPPARQPTRTGVKHRADTT